MTQVLNLLSDPIFLVNRCLSRYIKYMRISLRVVHKNTSKSSTKFSYSFTFSDKVKDFLVIYPFNWYRLIVFGTLHFF